MLTEEVKWEFKQLTQPTAGTPMTVSALKSEPKSKSQAELPKATPTRVHWMSFFAGAYCAFILQAILTLYLRV